MSITDLEKETLIEVLGKIITLSQLSCGDINFSLTPREVERLENILKKIKEV